MELKTYYAIVEATPNYILIEAISRAVAKEVLASKYGANNVLHVHRATSGDIEFVKWCEENEKRIEERKEAGEKPGDTTEHGMAHSGPRC